MQSPMEGFVRPNMTQGISRQLAGGGIPEKLWRQMVWKVNANECAQQKAFEISGNVLLDAV